MQYYVADDFKCTCGRPECNAELLDDNFLAVANKMIEEWGEKLKIDSGRRCKFKNTAVGGKSDSQHLFGKAGDFWVGNPVDVAKLAIIAARVGAGGIGTARAWFHMDTAGKGRRWTYPDHVRKV
jgi:uncharacterized protein YcbK (DUF882 family)